MGTEITVAIIGIIGVLIGLGVSYLQQASQRRWALDDQRREWSRQKWEEASKSFEHLEKVIIKAHLDDELTEDLWIDIQDSFSDTALKVMPLKDDKLEKIYKQLIEELNDFYEAKSGIKDKEEQDKYLLEIRKLGIEYLERINALIEQTYR